jgi:copper homeostasis protein
MSSGQQSTAIAGIKTLAKMIQMFGNQIEILPAAGINAENVAELIRQTGATQIHGSFSKPQLDPGYESGPIRFASNDQMRIADPEQIRSVVAIVNQLN